MLMTHLFSLRFFFFFFDWEINVQILMHWICSSRNLEKVVIVNHLSWKVEKAKGRFLFCICCRSFCPSQQSNPFGFGRESFRNWIVSLLPHFRSEKLIAPCHSVYWTFALKCDSDTLRLSGEIIKSIFSRKGTPTHMRKHTYILHGGPVNRGFAINIFVDRVWGDVSCVTWCCGCYEQLLWCLLTGEQLLHSGQG